MILLRGGSLVHGDDGRRDGCLILFGLGGEVDTPGIQGLFMCQFHSSSSSAILIHRFIFPFLLSMSLVMCLPGVLFLVVIISVISLDSKECSERNMCLFIGGEDSSLWAWVHTPCHQHLSGWLVAWASNNHSKVGYLPDDYCVFYCWDIEENFLIFKLLFFL